jgi:hypothetical protein
MTAIPPPDPNEPPPHQRGLTREERGRDVSAPQAEAEASVPKKLFKSMSLRFVLSQAEGYPVVIKQFLQFWLILIYPASVFGALCHVRGVLPHPPTGALHPPRGVLGAVLAAAERQKKNPEEYKEYTKKYWRRSWVSSSDPAAHTCR